MCGCGFEFMSSHTSFVPLFGVSEDVIQEIALLGTTLDAFIDFVHDRFVVVLAHS